MKAVRRRPRWRHVSAGFAPPGLYAGVPTWWGRRRWCEVEVVAAVMTNLPRCRERHVAPATAIRVAHAHAPYADGLTGRRCRPTNARLAAELDLSVRQIERARSLLYDLGLMVEVVRGRQWMTKAERLATYERGSDCRQLASEFALSSPRPVDNRAVRPLVTVGHVDPPNVPVGELVNSPDLKVLTGNHRSEERLRRTERRGRSRSRPVSPAQLRTKRLIAGVQAHEEWLAGVSARRLTSLHRFAQHGWTQRDVTLALEEVLRARSWTRPERLIQPAAYLAGLLRDVDPADRPTAAEEAQHAEVIVLRQYNQRRLRGELPICPHGEPGGAQPHPVYRVIQCAPCRLERDRLRATNEPAGWPKLSSSSDSTETAPAASSVSSRSIAGPPAATNGSASPSGNASGCASQTAPPAPRSGPSRRSST